MASTTDTIRYERQVTIWHNNIGRPIHLWGDQFYEGVSGVSPYYVGLGAFSAADNERFAHEFARTCQRYGAAIVVNNDHPRPLNHHVITIGVGHDDATWAESRFTGQGSMAAWLENTDQAHRPRQIAALQKAHR
jgi:hypothetical protein